jgi:hypothetical protein
MPRSNAFKIIPAGSIPSGVHISDPWPPRPMVVTSKLILPKWRFRGLGIMVELQESAGNNETPAAAAAESFMNWRRESFDFLVEVMADDFRFDKPLYKSKKKSA